MIRILTLSYFFFPDVNKHFILAVRLPAAYQALVSGIVTSTSSKTLPLPSQYLITTVIRVQVRSIRVGCSLSP